jgi:hypothetical protein
MVIFPAGAEGGTHRAGEQTFAIRLQSVKHGERLNSVLSLENQRLFRDMVNSYLH